MSAIIGWLFTIFWSPWAGLPTGFRRYSSDAWQNLRLGFLLTCTLLSLGLAVPMHGAVAEVLDELRTRLDEADKLHDARLRLVEEEDEVMQDKHTATSRTLDLLRRQHQAILRQIAQNDETRLHLLRSAVEILAGYEPGSRREVEAAVQEVERLVETLRRERRMLEEPDAPRELVSIIDMLLERTTEWLRLVINELPPVVPDLIGLPLPEAERELEEARLTRGQVQRRDVPDREPGTVVHQQPPPGARVRPGRAVDVWIASPPSDYWLWIGAGIGLLLLLSIVKLRQRLRPKPRPPVLRIESTRDIGQQTIEPDIPHRSTLDVRLRGHLDLGEQTVSEDAILTQGDDFHG